MFVAGIKKIQYKKNGLTYIEYVDHQQGGDVSLGRMGFEYIYNENLLNDMFGERDVSESKCMHDYMSHREYNEMTIDGVKHFNYDFCENVMCDEHKIVGSLVY